VINLNLNITEKKEVPLLNRVEVKGTVEFSGAATPSNQSLQDSIAKALGKEAKLVVVKHIYNNFGANSASVHAYAYNDEKKYDELEVKHVKVKAKKTEEAAPAAAPKKK
jgi:ribosomal protein S24E